MSQEYTFVIATSEVDAQGDQLVLEGIDFRQFEQTGRPVLSLWDDYGAPVGQMVENPKIENGKLVGRVRFFNDLAWEPGGMAFIPKKTRRSQTGNVYEQVEMLEYTVRPAKDR